jgi:hypothetical protein
MPSFSRASLVRFAVPVNKRMAALIASPRWGRFVGRRIVLLTYTGRRSVLGEGAPLSLYLDGTDRAGHATSRRDDKGQVTVSIILDR